MVLYSVVCNGRHGELGKDSTVQCVFFQSAPFYHEISSSYMYNEKYIYNLYCQLDQIEQWKFYVSRIKNKEDVKFWIFVICNETFLEPSIWKCYSDFPVTFLHEPETLCNFVKWYILETPVSAWPGKGSIGTNLRAGLTMTRKSVNFWRNMTQSFVNLTPL